MKGGSPSNTATPVKSTGSSSTPVNNGVTKNGDASSGERRRQAPAVAPGKEQSGQHHDLTHLYSNLDYVFEQPVYQYILEQAKLSGKN